MIDPSMPRFREILRSVGEPHRTKLGIACGMVSEQIVKQSAASEDAPSPKQTEKREDCHIETPPKRFKKVNLGAAAASLLGKNNGDAVTQLLGSIPQSESAPASAQHEEVVWSVPCIENFLAREAHADLDADGYYYAVRNAGRALVNRNAPKPMIRRAAKNLGVKLTGTWAGHPCSDQKRMYPNCGCCKISRSNYCTECVPWVANSQWCSECKNAAIFLWKCHGEEILADPTKQPDIRSKCKQLRRARSEKMLRMPKKMRCGCDKPWMQDANWEPSC